MGTGGSWGAVCPMCVARLRAGPGLLRLPATHVRRQEESYMECLICGEEGGGGGERVREDREVDDRVAVDSSTVSGPQPSGSMAWSTQPRALPSLGAHRAILVTYSFQSGIQSEGHPCPGAPYYAVGFPRHSLLPDTPLGREILSLLRGAWAAGCLFGVSASRTTGREYVVTWRPPPPAPPARIQHYPPSTSTAIALLHAAKGALARHVPRDY
ncbi:hypothetical protein evm_002525 [Chilo suppressalis]|nr:hypothetical protein evm_002525 [Chilo suppressalis]